jgi:hypothetical protein
MVRTIGVAVQAVEGGVVALWNQPSMHRASLRDRFGTANRLLSKADHRNQL